MNTLTIAIMSALFLLWSSISLAVEVDQKNPYEIVNHITENLFGHMKVTPLATGSDALFTEDAIKQELSYYLDHEFSALKVLGRNFKDYESAEIDKFVGVFKHYAVSVLINAFHPYTAQHVVFSQAKAHEDKRHATIRARIIKPGKVTRLTFQLRKDAETEKWFIYDFSTNGISMVTSLHRQFSPLLRSGDLAGATEKMARQ